MYSRCVGFVDTEDQEGNRGIGTCFHVGEGVFVTARHVLDGRRILNVDFDDISATEAAENACEPQELEVRDRSLVIRDLCFHPDPTVDVACFRLDYVPSNSIPLGGHFDDFLLKYELLLHPTLVLGYPPVPMTAEPVLIASLGEINASVTLRDRRHVHFLVSSMARGGFSGGPVLVAYNELNEASGTALLGIVTNSLVHQEGKTETGFLAVLSMEPVYVCLEHNGLLPMAQEILDLSR
ncbi:MAG: trypsin-like peptidase domain-containing protein [Planctomycetales bacterium]|nr:trypsin-like peptidase domain-containing protein [Planctomycetales bacterium]